MTRCVSDGNASYSMSAAGFPLERCRWINCSDSVVVPDPAVSPRIIRLVEGANSPPVRLNSSSNGAWVTLNRRNRTSPEPPEPMARAESRNQYRIRDCGLVPCVEGTLTITDYVC